MKSVAQILKSKADSSIYSIEPTTAVFEALKLMADKNIGSLLVMENSKIVGMFTERDYSRKVVLMGRTSPQTMVREIMTTPVLFVGPDHTSDQCMALMTQSRLRHLPVVENDQLLGIISIGDLVKDIISELQFTVEQLEHYITGAPSRAAV